MDENKEDLTCAIGSTERCRDQQVCKVNNRTCPTVCTSLHCVYWIRHFTAGLYRLATLAFRHFNGTLPPYLSVSLCTYQPSRFLCSSPERLLKIPKTNLKTFGGGSFGYIVPTVWNSLPAGLRDSPSLQTFKAKLRMHLFHQAF